MYTFIGDAGLDHYIDEDTLHLGGCSLNVATHFKRNSSEEVLLLYPNDGSTRIAKHCQREGIKNHPLQREGELPCQEIKILPEGEKQFLTYHSGVLEDFILRPQEIEMITKIQGFIVCPLYQQILSFIDQLIEHASGASFIFDFHSAEDFDKDFKRILPYLEKTKMAQFGLSPKDRELKEKLISYSLDTNCELLITEGKDQITFIGKKNIHHFTPKKIHSVVDSTGAGDAFLGSFLAMRKRMKIEQALAQASEYTRAILGQRGTL